MKYIRVKTIVAAVVGFCALAFSTVPSSAAAAKATSYEETIAVDISDEEVAAVENIRKAQIPNTYTMEKKTTSTSKRSSFGYILYRPDSDKTESKALIVYLHGLDGCGSNLDKLLSIEGIPNYISQGLIYPDAVVIAPQCPSGTNWVNMASEVMELIEQVIEEENIDVSRISLTGASLGGIGTYYLAYTNPTFFSAVVPVCGNVNASRCSVLTDVPVWIFHGTLDTAMGFSCKEANTVINNAGGTCTLTWIENEGHEIRHVYYDEEYDLINWMISQQRTDK